ncbi:hypothetical protein G7Y31_10570 [Corynebacterium lizhenjunii]|uniref:Uncharacterized protein n=1 Tax=Corynebacterium lizhenjunii TaxID=2709394 RepID=A0A7T0KF65_9CORY|nr:hypothetical protein [Corynebacterium lizhenjunii]QPK78939.1 hypothetical protein G7Y31_10570 [Corynebacterium lizhenjunii]
MTAQQQTTAAQRLADSVFPTAISSMLGVVRLVVIIIALGSLTAVTLALTALLTHSSMGTIVADLATYQGPLVGAFATLLTASVALDAVGQKMRADHREEFLAKMKWAVELTLQTGNPDHQALGLQLISSSMQPPTNRYSDKTLYYPLRWFTQQITHVLPAKQPDSSSLDDKAPAGPGNLVDCEQERHESEEH